MHLVTGKVSVSFMFSISVPFTLCQYQLACITETNCLQDFYILFKIFFKWQSTRNVFWFLGGGAKKNIPKQRERGIRT